MKIRVLGTGLTKFGERWDKSLLDLSQEACFEAIAEAGINVQDIDAIFVANMLYGKLSNQDQLGALVASSLNLHCASFKVEAACASGGLAVHLAIQAILSGSYHHVLVVGAEKMTDVSQPQISASLMGAGSENERRAGLTFPGLYALMAKAHMQKYATTRKQLAAVAVKNHYHAALNKLAQFPFEITEQKVLESPALCSPFSLFDASPITDGAGAVVLSADSQTTGSRQVFISGSAVASDTVDLSERGSLTETAATKQAARKALNQAGAEVGDINVAEVHDCFTIAEILAMEDLGFCKKGEGGKFIQSQHTRLGGKLPVNTSGGLKACGHPLSATGVKQIIEITRQLQKRGGQRQVKGANLGLTHNVGGTGATVVVHVLQA